LGLLFLPTAFSNGGKHMPVTGLFED